MSIATLVIGLGGTGVLTLRALKRLYLRLPARERVPASFLAIDFDRSALESAGNGELEDFGDDEFLFLNPRTIQDALRHLDRVHGDQPAWANVLDWFPERVTIPVSEVEANGASQLRVLGRLGFFLNDESLGRTVRAKLHEIGGEVDSVRLSEDKRVILVGSIAGGTGAGMLVDMAYLARRQMGRPRVFGYLMLPEVFQDVDNGGRILQNAYACIRELCYLKDQQIPIQARYFHLPPLDIPVHGEAPFSRIFLCPSQGFCGTDPILAANVRIAESILGQLQRDIQLKTLSVAANVVSGDALTEQGRKRSHCFSTSGSQFVPLVPIENLDEVLFDSALRALKQPSFLAQIFAPKIEATNRSMMEVMRAGSITSVDPREGEEDLKPSGDTQSDDTSHRRLIRQWRGRIERHANEAKEQIFKGLEQQLAWIDQRLRGGHSDEVNASIERLKQFGELAFSEFSADDKIYSRKLDLFRVLTAPIPTLEPGEKRQVLPSAFDQFDAGIRDEVRTHVRAALTSLGESALARRGFLKGLLDDPRLFFYPFPQTTEALTEIRKRWENALARLSSHQKRRWWRPSKSPKVNQMIASRRALPEVQAGLADTSVQGCLDSTLRVRAIKELRETLRRALEETEQSLPGKEVWERVPEAELAPIAKLYQLTEPLLSIALEVLRTKLPSLLEGARTFASEKDPEVLRQRLFDLVQERIGQDQGLSGDHMILELNEKDAQARLREALVRCRQSVFERRTPNVLRVGFAFIMVPKGLVWPGKDADHLLKFIKASAAQILDSQVQVQWYHGSRIWIYTEDLFNPPDHIRNIEDYYQSYQASEFVELYHIDRRFLKLREFLDIRTTVSAAAVTCGNDACSYGIANVPRDTRNCPGCHRPIRSRCGNPDCTASELHKDPRRQDKSCPFCQGFNHAEWWTCCRHGEIPEEISIDKELCPRCIEEHRRDPIAFPKSRIGKRPDVREALFCPNCEDLHEKDRSHETFRVPADLICFYLDGVNGHDSEKFKMLAAHHGLPDNVRCPNCRTLLIPVDHATGRNCCTGEELKCPTH
ncbi:MAG: tubulin-like doman-containing protein [Acidobacteriota bacterium]